MRRRKRILMIKTPQVSHTLSCKRDTFNIFNKFKLVRHSLHHSVVKETFFDGHHLLAQTHTQQHCHIRIYTIIGVLCGFVVLYNTTTANTVCACAQFP